MKPEKAIELHKMSIDTRSIGKAHPLYDVTIEALEKQIPRKPLKLPKPVRMFANIYTSYQCECGCLVDEGINYCFECGHKLDWRVKRNDLCSPSL